MTEQTKNQNQSQGRRQRRIERRQQRILEAAARVFARKTYTKTTTKEIAEEADMAEGTLYNYFGSKRDILLAIANESEMLMETVLLEGEGLQDREAVVRLFERGLEIFETQLPFIRTLFIESWVDDDILQDFAIVKLTRLHQRLVAYIAEHIDTGALRSVDPSLCARMALGMFGSLVLPALRGLEPPPAPAERRALAEAVVDILLFGISIQNT
ncbi:MAG: helix-turn-helix transcriptional regulator [Chloroflexi bacterium]|nr:helix-turn-helix transcriptional regulator [Chloroflexota bacterium]